MNSYGSSALPMFLTGLGTGIALTLLLAPPNGAATPNLIGHKINEGKDWIKAKSAAAEDYVPTYTAGLRDRVNEVA